VKIIISMLALLGAVAVPASVASAATAVPRPWVDSGVSFYVYQECVAQGQQAVDSDYNNYMGFSCLSANQNSNQGPWELWFDEPGDETDG
jgi:hypothetical protein